jgi:hypothetical protein
MRIQVYHSGKMMSDDLLKSGLLQSSCGVMDSVEWRRRRINKFEPTGSSLWNGWMKHD